MEAERRKRLDAEAWSAALERLEQSRLSVAQFCEQSFVFSYGGAWITCTEAVLGACGATPGLYQCTTSCRARS